MFTALLILIYLSFISLGLPDSLLGSAWPSIRLDFDLPSSLAGAVSMVLSGGTIVSSLLCTRLLKKLGTGGVTVLSVALTAAALLGYSVAPGAVWLFLLAVPLGLGAGAIDSALNNFVALHYRAIHMSWLHCFWGVGATLGPVLLSVCLAGGDDWRQGYRAIGLIQAALAVLLAATLPLWKRAEGSDAAAGEEQARSYPIRELLRVRGAVPVLLSFFCYCAIESVTGLWSGSYLVSVRGLSSDVAARFVSLYYLGITAGRFVSGFLTLKLSNRTSIRAGLCLCGLGALLLLTPLGNLSAQTGLLLIGAGCAPVFPCLLHETPKRFGKARSQSLMGLQMACSYTSTTLIPPLFGLTAQWFGLSLFPFALLLLFLLAMFVCEWANRIFSFKGEAEGTPCSASDLTNPPEDL